MSRPVGVRFEGSRQSQKSSCCQTARSSTGAKKAWSWAASTTGLLFVEQGFEELGDGHGLEFLCGLDEDGAIGTDGHGGAQGLLGMGSRRS